MGHIMRKLFATVGILGLAFAVTAGEQPPTPPTPTVSELIHRLGSEDYRDRQEAAAALEKAGPRAIPALHQAMKSESPEVRLRVTPILVKLERAATSSDKLAAKKVKLSYKDVPLGTAFNDLRMKTGLNLSLDPEKIGDPFRKVTCVTDELPVWEALDAFCTAAGLKEEFRNELEAPKNQRRGNGYIAGYQPVPTIGIESVPIMLVEGKPVRVVGDRRTAVRVLALPPSFPGHRVTLGTGETTLCFDITPAPGLNWQGVTAVKITKLIDDAGRVGGAAAPKAQFNGFEITDGWGNAPAAIQFNGRFDARTGIPYPLASLPNPRVHPIALKLATPAARSIKRLEGSVFSEIVVNNQTLLTINDAAKYIGVPFDGPGDVRLTVVSITEDKAGAKVQLLLEYPTSWAQSWRRGTNPGGIWPEAPQQGTNPTLLAFNAEGKPMLPQLTSNFPNASDDGTTMLHRFEWTFRKDTGVPAKFVVTGPRSMAVEVPFVLENVPMP